MNSNLTSIKNKKQLNFYYESVVVDTSQGIEWNIYHNLGYKPTIMLCSLNSSLNNRTGGFFYPDYDQSTNSYIRIKSYAINPNTGVYRFGLFAI